MNPWRWRFKISLCHTRDETSRWKFSCEFSSNSASRTYPLPWNWIFINWTLDSRHTILWVPPETITLSSSEVGVSIEGSHAVEWRLVLVVTRQTSIQFDGLVQERRNSITHALEFRISCTNPSTCGQSTVVVLDLQCVWDICCDVTDNAIWVLADRNKRYWRMFLKTYHFCGYELVLYVCILFIC